MQRQESDGSWKNIKTLTEKEAEQYLDDNPTEAEYGDL
jgi:hypothetical protein